MSPEIGRWFPPGAVSRAWSLQPPGSQGSGVSFKAAFMRTKVTCPLCPFGRLRSLPATAQSAGPRPMWCLKPGAAVTGRSASASVLFCDDLVCPVRQETAAALAQHSCHLVWHSHFHTVYVYAPRVRRQAHFSQKRRVPWVGRAGAEDTGPGVPGRLGRRR